MNTINILYICDSLNPYSGVFQKVMAQTGEWEKAGHRVWIATQVDLVPKRRSKVAFLASEGKLYHTPTSVIDRVFGQIKRRVLSLGILKSASMLHKIDLVYARELSRGFGIIPFLHTTDVIVEINGDITWEYSGIKRAKRKFRRDLLLKYAAGVIFVSRQLRDSCCISHDKTTVIANACFGTLTHDNDLRASADKPALVFIGAQKHDWHGVDKVEYLARAFPEFDFHIIGSEMSQQNNIFNHGTLPEEEINKILRRCHVGISSLALHRKNMNEASPLKSRQYLASGLPVIQGYEDTDIASNSSCILQLPNTNDNCQKNLEKIRAFVLEAYSSSRLSTAALNLAEGPLSIREKEKSRMRFFKKCLRNTNHA